MERIAFVKAGWAEDYQGEEVVGRHGFIKDFSEAHERFNFMKGPDGRYYGYIYPIGQYESCPKPAVTTGWLVIVVAARDGDGPLTVVGWYENATFERDYTPRPEYEAGDFELDIHGNQYAYCFSADKATLIPLHLRQTVVSGDHFKRTSVIYARGNRQQDAWRDAFAALAEQVVGLQPAIATTKMPWVTFPDKAHRDKVEAASVELFKKTYSKAYRLTDRQKDNCGYDFLLVHKTTREELHVEVKGTSGKTPHFFMSRNEHNYLADPRWRLFMVTDALGKPRKAMMDLREVNRVFDLVPFAYQGVSKIEELD